MVGHSKILSMSLQWAYVPGSPGSDMWRENDLCGWNRFLVDSAKLFHLQAVFWALAGLIKNSLKVKGLPVVEKSYVARAEIACVCS